MIWISELNKLPVPLTQTHNLLGLQTVGGLQAHQGASFPLPAGSAKAEQVPAEQPELSLGVS